MTRGEAANLWPTMKAYAEGEDVEVKIPPMTSWCSATAPTFSEDCEYRVAAKEDPDAGDWAPCGFAAKPIACGDAVDCQPEHGQFAWRPSTFNPDAFVRCSAQEDIANSDFVEYSPLLGMIRRADGRQHVTTLRLGEVSDGNQGSGSAVDHPSHYNEHPSGVEAIDICEHMNFCTGSAMKYLWRAGLKGDAIEDLKKAIWCIEREIARREQNPDN